MKFKKVDLETLLSEVRELPADWLDDLGRELVKSVSSSVKHLRIVRDNLEINYVANLLRKDPLFIDVCRLFFGEGQETVAHKMADQLGLKSIDWNKIRKIVKTEPERIATALVALGLPEAIKVQIEKHWTVEEVLLDRYRTMRGRAIAGQQRGRDLEDRVEAVLRRSSAPFERGVTFIGKGRETAKCDFALPTKDHPKIIVEAKGFEATGSKLTDFLGDVLKIINAKSYHMYFFLVTDGRGWLNRQSDLKKLVEFHQNGDVDMIYSIARLGDLEHDVQEILEKE